jgi:hypothetical protein
MFLGLNGYGAVSILIDRPGSKRAVSDVPPFGVRGGQPMHETGEFVRVWPKHEVPMVWHYAVGQQPKGFPFERLGKDLLEGRIVSSVEE